MVDFGQVSPDSLFPVDSLQEGVPQEDQFPAQLRYVAIGNLDELVLGVQGLGGLRYVLQPGLDVVVGIGSHDSRKAFVEHEGKLLEVGLEGFQGGQEQAAHFVVDPPSAVEPQLTNVQAAHAAAAAVGSSSLLEKEK